MADFAGWNRRTDTAGECCMSGVCCGSSYTLRSGGIVEPVLYARRNADGKNLRNARRRAHD